MCIAFVFFLKNQNILLEKAVLNFRSLIHSYVYIHIALCYQDLYLQESCHHLAMAHSV